MNEIVRKAIMNTPAKYFQQTLDQRNPGPDSCGSTFLKPQDMHSLMEADWIPYGHPDIKSPAKGFRAPIPGFLGVVPVEKTTGILIVTTSSKDTGFIELQELVMPGADHQRIMVDYSTAIIGPGDHGEEILYTVFPGQPIAPSTLAGVGGPKEVSREEAKQMGFTYAKVVSGTTIH